MPKTECELTREEEYFLHRSQLRLHEAALLFAMRHVLSPGFQNPDDLYYAAQGFAGALKSVGLSHYWNPNIAVSPVPWSQAPDVEKE